ncbi:MAG: hypothetical protein AAGE83_04195 [Pseudomonadota bacterium]
MSAGWLVLLVVLVNLGVVACLVRYAWARSAEAGVAVLFSPVILGAVWVGAQEIGINLFAALLPLAVAIGVSLGWWRTAAVAGLCILVLFSDYLLAADAFAATGRLIRHVLVFGAMAAAPAALLSAMTAAIIARRAHLERSW